MKKCVCKTHVGDVMVALSGFGVNLRTTDGLDYYCLVCRRASVAAYNIKVGKHVAISRAKEWSVNNRDRVNTTSQRYRERNKEQRKQTTKKWREANKGLSCYLANKRRAAKLRATPGWYEEPDVRQLYLSCLPTHEVHHIVPLQGDEDVCGLHCKDNLIILTKEAHKAIHKDKLTLAESYNWPVMCWIML